jgi:hypothetical protein
MLLPVATFASPPRTSSQDSKSIASLSSSSSSSLSAPAPAATAANGGLTTMIELTQNNVLYRMSPEAFSLARSQPPADQIQ